MTYALGGWVENALILRTNSTDRLRELWTKGGGAGVKKARNFADVKNGWSLSITASRQAQGFTVRAFPGCENVSGKLQVEAEVVSNNRNTIQQTWERPYSQALYITD